MSTIQRFRLLPLLLAAAAAACAQQPTPAPAPTPAQPPQAPAQPPQAQAQPPQAQPQGDAAAQGRATAAAMLAQFAEQKVEVDLKAGTVTIPAVVNAPPDPIEYLLIHRTGKRHEAMFWTRSKPSVLNAALLLLGLVPGHNATCKEKDPAPTLEEIEKGADPLIVTPPAGQELWMTVSWKDEAGKVQEHCIEDFLVDLTAQAPVRDASWIYIGGRMASLYKGEPEEFVADFEGNLVSVCYLTPDNHLATMKHERARDDQNWWITDLLPPPGTEVRFVFHKEKSELHKAREKRLAEEDAQAKKDEAGKKDGK
jgi:hypothetical protein